MTRTVLSAMHADKRQKTPELEQQQLERLTRWLKEHGAQWEGMELAYLAPGYRGVVTTLPRQKKDRLVFVPRQCLITLEMCRQDPVCRALTDSSAELVSPKHTFMAVFILQERAKPQSPWQPYLQLLPQDVSSFPINYTNQELTQLIGSPFLLLVHEKVVDLKRDYDAVYAAAPDFRSHSFRDFCWGRMMVGSRMFGVHIDGAKTDILAPFADMLNHRLPKQSSWNYLQQEGGFAIESLGEVEAGQELFDSYGRKCNTRYLLNYGFIVPHNPENLIYLRIDIAASPLAQRKLEMIRKSEGVKVLKASADLNDNNFFETMGFLRFRAISSANQIATLEKISGIKLTQQPYVPSKTPPMTLELELEVWAALKELCESSLRDYPTTVEQDEGLLASEKDMTDNMRNIVTLRKEEKQLYLRYVALCQEVIDTLRLGYLEGWEAACKAEGKPWRAYLLKIYSIMPHELRKELGEIRVEQPRREEGSQEEELSDDE